MGNISASLTWIDSYYLWLFWLLSWFGNWNLFFLWLCNWSNYQLITYTLLSQISIGMTFQHWDNNKRSLLYFHHSCTPVGGLICSFVSNVAVWILNNINLSYFSNICVSFTLRMCLSFFPFRRFLQKLQAVGPVPRRLLSPIPCFFFNLLLIVFQWNYLWLLSAILYIYSWM